MTGDEGFDLQRVETVGRLGDLAHANAQVLAAHELTGRSVEQPKAGAAPLEPEPQALVRLSLGHASGTLDPTGHAGVCPHHGSPTRVFRDEADTTFVAKV